MFYTLCVYLLYINAKRYDKIYNFVHFGSVMRKSFLKHITEEVIRTVDIHSGELISEDKKRHSYLANTKEEFFICYASIIGIFMNMTQAQARIFGYCLRYRNAKFDISKNVRLSMGKEIGLNERTIFKTLPILLEKKLIYKTEDNLYGINPRYIFYGSTHDRNKSLKALIDVSCLDC